MRPRVGEVDAVIEAPRVVIAAKPDKRTGASRRKVTLKRLG